MPLVKVLTPFSAVLWLRVEVRQAGVSRLSLPSASSDENKRGDSRGAQTAIHSVQARRDEQQPSKTHDTGSACCVFHLHCKSAGC